jgi:hypothetical protein
MTVRTLRSIARLPQLASWDLAAARFTANDILAYLQAQAIQTTSSSRKNEAFTSRSEITTAPVFYCQRSTERLWNCWNFWQRSVMNRWACHAATKSSSCTSKPVRIQSGPRVGGNYLTNQLIPAVEAARSVHPTLQSRVVYERSNSASSSALTR